MAQAASPRTYRIEHKRDLRGTGLDWRLYTYGPGHWCIGEGHSGSFRTDAEAVAAGEDWLATGRSESRQEHAPASATPTEAAVAANRLDHSGRRAAA